jgi:hypothetical protein
MMLRLDAAFGDTEGAAQVLYDEHDLSTAPSLGLPAFNISLWETVREEDQAQRTNIGGSWHGQEWRKVLPQNVSDTVFVLAAHVNTRHQANQLLLTLSAIKRHHPTAAVIVIDNVSQLRIDLSFLPGKWMQRYLFVVRAKNSHYEFGAYATGLAWLQYKRWLEMFDRFVFMQGQMVLTVPVPYLTKGCELYPLHSAHTAMVASQKAAHALLSTKAFAAALSAKTYHWWENRHTRPSLKVICEHELMDSKSSFLQGIWNTTSSIAANNPAQCAPKWSNGTSGCEMNPWSSCHPYWLKQAGKC